MNYKSNARRGFTLAEVLTVIAVIALLAAVAIPGVSTMLQNMKMAELEAATRSIFVAAQGRMSELRIAGKLDGLDGVGMTECPADYPATLGAWDDSVYYYLGSDTASELLLPAGTIETSAASGTFYIEYNAQTGMVYGVFYSDTAFDYSTSLPRSASALRAHSPMLSYYGGDDIDFSAPEFAPVPVFTITNSDKLFATLTGVPSATYTIEITDGVDIVTYSTDDFVGRPPYITEHGGTFTVLMDGMESGDRFGSLFPSLMPGSNITVTVTASVPDLISTSASKSTNSLFASRTDGTVAIAVPRHLQNLHPPLSGVDAAIDAAALNTLVDWSTTALPFASIDNPNLVAFNGNGNAIYKLNGTLFNRLTAATIENVSLIDVSIVGDGNHVGALANEADGTTFTKCRVYADAEPPATATSCTVESSGALTTGGLVGYATGCTITESFAALTRITADSGYVGGLVGSTIDTRITNSYASTGVWSTDAESWLPNSGIALDGINMMAGGLVGIIADGRVENTYAMSNISAVSGVVAGFAGQVNDLARVQNSYCMTTFDGNAASNVFGFAQSDGDNVNDATCYYYGDPLLTGEQRGTPLTYESLRTVFASDSAWSAATDITTKAYGRTGEILPFRTLRGIPHHGDWPDLSIRGGVYYYEQYADGSYGYSPVINGNALRNDREVRRDGYVLILDGEEPTATLSGRAALSGSAYQSVVLAPDNTWESIPLKTVYPISAAHLSSISSGAIYYEIVLDSRSLYFNPDFAKTVTSTAPTAHADAKDYEVRTARHLAQLGARMSTSPHSAHYPISTYTQTRNIDFTTYGTAQTVTPIGDSATRFAGSYDGGGNTITVSDISGTSNVALFGNLSGSVLRVHLIGKSGARVTATGTNAGGLVGDATDATIENCTVENLTVSGNGNVGGAVGNMSGGTVDSCTTTDVLVTSTGTNAGGLVGNAAADSIIKNSSASGTTVNGMASVGGFVGQNAASITNCFAAGGSISGSTSVGGFVGDNNGGAISNCAAASGYFAGNPSGGAIYAASYASTIGGFVGHSHSGGSIERCYTMARFSGAYAGGFVGVNTTGSSIDDSYCASLNNSGTYVGFGTGGTQSGTMAFDGNNRGALLAAYSSAPWGRADVAHSHPYDLRLTGLAYSLPAIVRDSSNTLIHYGNWPEPSVSGIAYYEQYADGTRGIYAIGMDGTVYNTLSNTAGVVTDGYAFIIPNRLGGDIAYRNNTASNTYTDYTLNNNGSWAYTADSTAYPLADELLDLAQMVGQSTYYAFSIDNVTSYVNPDFAKTATSANPGTGVPSGAVYEVRTARQLAALGNKSSIMPHSLHYASCAYNQTRDIDFAAYIPTQTAVPIGGAQFSGTFDGGGHTINITNMVSGSANVGLFGSVSGTLSNINLRGTVSGGTVSGGSSTGALAGVLDGGRIENSTVYGISVTGSGNAGGVVGLMRGGSIVSVRTELGGVTAHTSGGIVGQIQSGTITNCITAGANIAGSVAAGGFVGSMNGGAITLSASAHGVFQEIGAQGGSVGGPDNATGGFVGKMGGGTIEHCYAVASLTFATSKNGFTGSGTSGIINSYCVTTDVGDRYVAFGSTEPDSCYAFNGMNLMGIIYNFSGAPWGVAYAEHTFPYESVLMDLNYPFPAVVTDSAGNFVHYGNWSNPSEVNNTNYLTLCYYEKYGGAEYGLMDNILGLDGLQDNKAVIETGYMMLIDLNNYGTILNNINKVNEAFKMFLILPDGTEVPAAFNWLNGPRFWVGATQSVNVENGNGGIFTYNGHNYIPAFLPSSTTDLYIGVRIRSAAGTELLVNYWR